jgi:hypothetical protein
VFRLLKVSELMFAQVSHLNLVRQGISYKIAGGPREKGLPAVSHGAQAGTPVHGAAIVVTFSQVCFACVQGYTYL